MCGITAIRTDLRVSVQDKRAPDREAGHLAAGVLVDGDWVMVPDPAGKVLDPKVELEVVIFPVPVRLDMAVEAFGPPKAITNTLRARPAPTSLTLKLSGHSRYAAQFGELRPDALAGELERRDGQLWPSLEAAGVIPAGLREISAETLREVSRIEREQHRPRRLARVAASYPDMIFDWCWLCCCCEGRG